MTGQMEDVISLSSDDSDVEIVGSYGGFTKSKPPPPLSEVRVDVEAVNVNIPRHYIDLTDPRWACPELKLRPRFNIPGSPVIDLTANETKLETKPETKSSLALTETRVTKPEIKGCFEIGDSQFNQSIVNKNNVLNGQGLKLQESSSGHSHIFPLQQDCGTQSPKQRRLNSPMQPQKQNLAKQPSQDAPDVEPDQLPFIESHIKNLKTSGSCGQLTNDSPQMSLCFKPNNRFEAQESATSSEIFSSTLYVSLTESTVPKCLPIMLKSTTKEHENPQEYTSNLLQAQATQDLQIPTDCPNAGHDDANLKQHKTVENKLDGFHSSDMIPSSTSYQDKTQKEAICSNLEKLDLYHSESGQRSPS
ncbi:uncharacterized protein simc1 isoform X1 [Xiphophorus hellerii]|uniref:uncharacterized protein simc1 isoform X1 n=1 Tax=Xiphophorus hellerii TaxID=8084 RepID=UPI0013B3B61B|nr:SUMO-interacting motif-containing protein 1 isoform X1 [Xiphophorus hellerii]